MPVSAARDRRRTRVGRGARPRGHHGHPSRMLWGVPLGWGARRPGDARSGRGIGRVRRRPRSPTVSPEPVSPIRESAPTLEFKAFPVPELEGDPFSASVAGRHARAPKERSRPSAAWDAPLAAPGSNARRARVGGSFCAVGGVFLRDCKGRHAEAGPLRPFQPLDSAIDQRDSMELNADSSICRPPFPM